MMKVAIKPKKIESERIRGFSDAFIFVGGQHASTSDESQQALSVAQQFSDAASVGLQQALSVAQQFSDAASSGEQQATFL